MKAHLRVRTAVVDDDVSNDLEPLLVHHRDAVPQLCLCAIAGVEIVQITRQVALRAHGIAWRRQPHRGDARLSYPLCSTGQHLHWGALLDGYWIFIQATSFVPQGRALYHSSL